MKAFLMAALVLVPASAMAAQADYVVDPAASKVEWVGKKVTGQHNGSIAVKSGSVKLNGNKLVGGRFSIDMTSIQCADLTDAEYNKKLIGHLESDDFFSSAKYNEATLVVKSVKERASDVEINGDLTIKGTTLPISFPAKIIAGADKISATGKMLIDRTKYGIKYGSGRFFQNLGDKMINDQFELSFSLIAKK
ncbi:MAG: hypothetical protein A2X94_00550 [Bdellovibrionales bacterium GWB1_55_8]|nr:MAG: hypothetical protein A2X94_00550 [Bdellovibrionales bacterium GWB1_55_8]